MKAKTKTVFGGAVALLLAGFLLGRGCRPRTAPPSPTSNRQPPAAAPAEDAVEFWTCSMHPQIHKPGPGLCPICGMELIPVTAAAAGEEREGAELTLSPRAQKMAAIETAPVERKFVTAETRVVGKVDYDETRLAYITAWVPGRLDELYVDFAGVPVKKGDHMVYLYSPELLSSQEELIQTAETVRKLERSDVTIIRERAAATLESAREKLRLFGLTREQIADIERKKVPSDHITIYAPISGIVIQKNAQEGMYVKTGTRIYSIADLSQVWVKLDIYESDLARVRYGQHVHFEAEAYPGEIFRGTIAFIDPVMDEKTRTVKVRVNVPNPRGRLRPGMFVRGIIRSRMTASGMVMDPDLAGKWICPMHPEMLKKERGQCDICGMDLVATESMGFLLPGASEAEPPIIIPATAPLITGTRAVVYVALPGEEGRYEGREVVLGPRAGSYYIVQSGLEEGEMVVVNGNFKIDSAVQILAKPSMMSPEAGKTAAGRDPEGSGGKQAGDAHPHQGSATKQAPGEKRVPEASLPAVPAAFQTQLHDLLRAYERLAAALTKNDPKGIAKAVADTRTAYQGVDMKLLKNNAHMIWMKHAGPLHEALNRMDDATHPELLAGFASFSEHFRQTLKSFGTGQSNPLYVLRCPMAFDGRGATWLQTNEATRNPYFAGSMLKCGSVIETLTKE